VPIENRKKWPFAAANFRNCLGFFIFSEKYTLDCKFLKLPRKYEKAAICGCKFQKVPMKYEKSAVLGCKFVKLPRKYKKSAICRLPD
jgi:hypothetical protein